MKGEVMAQVRERTEISDVDDLRKLAEEVRTSGTPRLLVLGDEEVAMLVPVGMGDDPRSDVRGAAERGPEKLRAYQDAFGSWKGHVDPEALKAQFKAARGSRRPPVKL